MSQPTTELSFETVFAEELGELYPREGAGPGTRRTLAEIHDEVHERFRPSALCLSGGGIRSATFALGVVQGLARRGLLQGFQYLSTVSGGGYLGGWLTAWIHRHRDGLEGVCRDLAGPEPEPVRRLRSYSNYLTPRLGLLSADSWTLAATLLRNLLLNWCVLVPLLLAVVAVPWLVFAVQALGSSSALPSWLLATTAAAGFALSAVMAVAYLNVEQPGAGIQPADDRGRTSPPQVSRDQSAFLLSCWLPLLASAVCLTTYWGWVAGRAEAPGGFQFIAFVAGAHVTGWLLSLPKRRRLPGVFDGLVALVSGAVGGIGAWLAASHAGLGVGVDARMYAWLAVPAFLGLFLIAGSAYVALATSRMETTKGNGPRASGPTGPARGRGLGGTAVPLVLFGPDWLDGARGRLGFGSIGGLSGLVAVLFLGGSSAAPQGTTATATASGAPARPPGSPCCGPGPDRGRAALPRLPGAGVVVAPCTRAPARLHGDHRGDGRGVGPRRPRRDDGLRAHARGPRRRLRGHRRRAIPVRRRRFAVRQGEQVLAALDVPESADPGLPGRFTVGGPAAEPLHRLRSGRQPGDAWLRGRTRPRGPAPGGQLRPEPGGGDELAWQQRKAERFTLAAALRGRPGRLSPAPSTGAAARAISLGTAVAISGAAASPNMGYHSSPVS